MEEWQDLTFILYFTRIIQAAGLRIGSQCQNFEGGRPAMNWDV